MLPSSSKSGPIVGVIPATSEFRREKQKKKLEKQEQDRMIALLSGQEYSPSRGLSGLSSSVGSSLQAKSDIKPKLKPLNRPLESQDEKQRQQPPKKISSMKQSILDNNMPLPFSITLKNPPNYEFKPLHQCPFVCNHFVTRPLDVLVRKFLTQMSKIDKRSRRKLNAQKRNYKRRPWLLGFKPILSYLKDDMNTPLKVVFIAHNLPFSPGFMNESLSTVFSTCTERQIPVIFSLTRSLLGYHIGIKGTTSIISFTRIHSGQPGVLFQSILELHQSLLRDYSMAGVTSVEKPLEIIESSHTEQSVEDIEKEIAP